MSVDRRTVIKGFPLAALCLQTGVGLRPAQALEMTGHVVLNPCIGAKDTACVDVCPVDCIYGYDDDDADQVFIHPEECIDCGLCVDACPVEAIYPSEEAPEALNPQASFDKAVAYLGLS